MWSDHKNSHRFWATFMKYAFLDYLLLCSCCLGVGDKYFKRTAINIKSVSISSLSLSLSHLPYLYPTVIEDHVSTLFSLWVHLQFPPLHSRCCCCSSNPYFPCQDYWTSLLNAVCLQFWNPLAHLSFYAVIFQKCKSIDATYQFRIIQWFNLI